MAVFQATKTIVLVFYWCVRNYYKLRDLKQGTFMISQFLWVKPDGLSWVLWSGSQKQMSARLHSFQELGVLFQAHMAVSRAHFLAIAGLWCPSSRWLLVGAAPSFCP